jgi:hypothetical protein
MLCQAMQRKEDTLIHSRVANPFITAAYDHLIKAFQPAQAATSVQFDKCRIYHFADRRFPANSDISGYSFQEVMPRVGTTEIFIAPVSISTIQTPSCRPPCRTRMRTEKGLEGVRPRSWLEISQFCGAVYVSSSTRSHARALVIASVLIRPMRNDRFHEPFIALRLERNLKSRELMSI